MVDVFLYTEEGSKKDTFSLDVDIQEKEQNSAAYSCVVRKLRQNWRQGTVACKGRSEVDFSTKKPWKQKGTGRARAGSLRSPLWRKGGVIFGPQKRVKTLDVNRKLNKHALNNTFFKALRDNGISCLDFTVSSELPNTKSVRLFLKKSNLLNKRIVLFLPFNDEINFASFRNLANVDILSFDQPNAFDLSSNRHWVFLKKDLELFKDMVAKWN